MIVVEYRDYVDIISIFYDRRVHDRVLGGHGGPLRSRRPRLLENVSSFHVSITVAYAARWLASLMSRRDGTVD